MKYNALRYLCLLAPAVAVCALLSCTKESGTPESSGSRTVTLEASQGDPRSRLDYREENGVDGDPANVRMRLSWSDGEKIGLWDMASGGTGNLFTLTEGAGSNRGIFTGSVPGSGSVATPMQAVYPAPDAAVSAADLTYSVEGQRQKGNGDTGHLSACHHMTGEVKLPGYGSDKPATCLFEHRVAMFRFSIRIPAGSGTPERLSVTSGTVSFDVQRKTKDGSSVKTASGLSLLLDLSQGWSDGETLTAYMMILPCDLTGNLLRIEVQSDAGTYAFSNRVTKPYEAGRVYTFDLDDGQVAAPDIFDASTPAAAHFGGTGDGSRERPWLVGSASELKKLAEDVNGGATADGYAGRYFRLAADIEVAAGTPWEPIGHTRPFKGYFDGGLYAVSGTLSGSAACFGFFGRVSGGSVSGLIVDAAVRNDYSGTGDIYTGAIAGELSQTPLEDCLTRGSVAGGNSVDEGACGTGGIAGNIRPDSPLRRVINRAEIYGGDGGMKATGGIAGFFESTLQEVLNTGTVRSHTTVAAGSVATGGIVGVNYGIIHTSRNEGDVFSSPAGAYDSFTGGVAGYNPGTVWSCSSNGGAVDGVPAGTAPLIGMNDGNYRDTPHAEPQ